MKLWTKKTNEQNKRAIDAMPSQEIADSVRARSAKETVLQKKAQASISKHSSGAKVLSISLVRVIRKPLLTEKALLGQSKNQYAFEVGMHASKIDIKRAVESLYGVSVRQVNVMNFEGKSSGRSRRYRGKRRDWKKAIVHLAPGQSIAQLVAKHESPAQ